MRERWRKVRRCPCHPCHKVSSLARLNGRGGPLTPFPDDDGYLRVTLHGEQVLLSHVVLEAFEGPRPYGCEALHHPVLSQGRDDCRAVVLRWGTHRENEQDKRKTAGRAELEGGTRPYSPETLRQSDVQ